MGCNNNNQSGCEKHREEVIVSPTERIVNTRTNTRTIKRIHPTEIINVNRTIIRNENFYPVTEREVNETIEENYDCGSDVNNPNCRKTNNINNNGLDWLFRL
ncbi:spore coat protein [Caldibacillus lycopersici]|uniref:Spore coat protein n=1 Tax=Perspicuibacillus lycopersici TaxID=1325689 RepID=A0AAE3IQ28_9BACI|nr:spore coat protein [Perspicuibacillus lycopersici]MCU9612337.1 spore coat protein [Perspicuibacillus lycopersici]